MPKDDDDKDKSLLELVQQDSSPLVSQLIQIGKETNQQDHSKHLTFIKQLQCLKFQGSKLCREKINAVRQRSYVALSYTWDPSEHETNQCGHYFVENWDNRKTRRSPVRNSVFDRIFRFMSNKGVQYLWIDRHCIRQNTCEDDSCYGHPHCDAKRNAVQAMDFVYKISNHPVALLGRPLSTRSDLALLSRILRGDLFVDRDGEMGADSLLLLDQATHIGTAEMALRLLSDITQDKWWHRAWTFQENYRGGEMMQLMIPHPDFLEKQKQRYKCFGNIPGELCIPSVTFSKEATRLCRALELRAAELTPGIQGQIKGVLRAAGRYTITLDSSSSMTPAVVADVEARNLSKPWDRLAIVANCNQYSVWLDIAQLKRQQLSLSLSVLATCLINGEILDNSGSNAASVAELTSSGLLQKLMFRSFQPPIGVINRLTFNKGCRLVRVQLTAQGLATTGHMWKLEQIIDTTHFSNQLPYIFKPEGRLGIYKRKRLLQFTLYLKEFGHRWLAARIQDWLDDEPPTGTNFHSSSELYLHYMANEVAEAICSGGRLRLGRIMGRRGQRMECSAVFVLPSGGYQTAQKPEAYAFTSIQPGDTGSHTHDANDCDRHVSLEVKVGNLTSGGDPQLRVQRWLHGMCFFEGCGLSNVVFPWPPTLLAIR